MGCFIVALAASAALTACDENAKSQLKVRVVTDLVAVGEFSRIETALFTASDVSGVAADEMPFVPELGTTFVRGVDVATFDDVRNGEVVVRVRARKPSGEVVVEQFARTTLKQNYTLSVFLDRQCTDVDCSAGAAGNAAAIACYMGQCVDPRCKPDDQSTIEFCGEVDFCQSSTQCPDIATCATQTCVNGLCIAEQNTESNGGCAAGSYCDLTSSSAMCLPLMTADADAGVPMDATLPDAATDASEDMGATVDAAPDATRDMSPDAPLAVCGDGVTEGAEVCDDSNTDNDDDCSSNCRQMTCYATDAATLTSTLARSACRRIEIASGTYEGNFSTSRQVTLVGAGRTLTILDGRATGSALKLTGTMAEVRIESLTVRNGRANDGAGLYTRSVATLVDVRVTDNVAVNHGGGIYAEHGLTLENCEVDHNTTGDGGGGGIQFNKVGKTLLVRGSSIHDNRSIAQGGAVNVQAAAWVTIDTSTFANNATTTSSGGAVGGALNVHETMRLAVTDSDFSSNSATQTSESGILSGYAVGGAICTLGVPITVVGSTFTDNTASSDAPDASVGGGAIGLSQRSGDSASLAVDIDDSTFTRNVAQGSGARGGAISVSDSTVTIDNSSFEANESRASYFAEGGAFSSMNSGDVRFSNSTLSGNRASASTCNEMGGCGVAGGAICTRSTTVLSVSGSVFMENESYMDLSAITTYYWAAPTGGAIFTQTTPLSIDTSAFSSNIVRFDQPAAAAYAVGAGVHQSDGESFTIDRSAFVDNQIIVDDDDTTYTCVVGGAGLASNGAGTITRTLFANNTSANPSTYEAAAQLILRGATDIRSSTIYASPSATLRTVVWAESTINIVNSIIDGPYNYGSVCSGSPSGHFISQGFNVLAQSCAQTPLSSDVTLVSGGPFPYASLAPVAYNATTAPYYFVTPTATSPAVDHGDPAGCIGAITDSFDRARVSTCDSGAYEYTP